VLVSNTAIAEQVCTVVKMLDSLGGESTFLLPDDPSEYFGSASKLRSAIDQAGLSAETVFVNDNSDLRFLKDAVVIPQTQYLDDHLPNFLLTELREGQCFYAPYGYCVRTVEHMIDQIADDTRFGGGLVPQAEHHGRLLLQSGFSLVGHPKIFEIAQFSQRSNTSAPHPRVGLHLHWTAQYCSLTYSIGLIEQLSLQFMEKFGFPLMLLNHPFLHGFGIEVPIDYSAFTEVDSLSRLRALIDKGLLLHDGSTPLNELLPTFDLIISDGQSLIAFAAATGVHVAVPELPTSAPLTQRIMSLPNVTQFNPLDHETSLGTFWEIIGSRISSNPTETYFHHFDVDPKRSPIDLWLQRNG
jgi:hypothetical protein